MSGTEPVEPTAPPVLLPGAAMDAFIGSIAQLARAGPVIIGGLAVMSRVGGEHRPTLDIDSVFNNETETPTATALVAGGIATDEAAIQRIRIDDALVDVIDTFPIDPDDLPDDPKDRLFVCAHRYAYETATEVDVVGDTNRVTVRVATVEALIATKSHALRFGGAERRRRKRSSDLYDVVRLTTAGTGALLVGSPWDLRNQVLAALAADLADLPAASAVLQGSAVRAIRDISPDLLELVIGRLLARLAE